MEENVFAILQKPFDLNHHNIYIGFQEAMSAMHIKDDTKPIHILQFVVSGKGGYYLEGSGFYSIKQGSVFWLPKGKNVSYWPCANDGYEYYYLGVDVLDGDAFFEQIGFTEERPVLQVEDNRILEAIAELYVCFKERTLVSNFKGLSRLYEIFGLLAKQNPHESNVLCGNNAGVERVLIYLNHNYMNDITVEQLADLVHMNRCYFSMLFKRHTGLSPLQYLIDLRITQASKMLVSDVTVTEVAIATGFNSVTKFGVHFKKRMKMSPMAYKKYLMQVSERPIRPGIDVPTSEWYDAEMNEDEL